MEESAFQSQFTKTSGSMPLTSAAESDNSVSGPRVAALAVIMCFCLMAMAVMVLALIITTSDILGGGSTVARTDADIDSGPLANPRPSAAKHPTPATPEQTSSTPPTVGGGSTVARTDADIDSGPLANPRPSAAKHPTPATPEQTSSTPPMVKEIICTVSESAGSESVYPPDKDLLPEKLDHAAGALSALRNEGIKHYGLLRALVHRSDFSYMAARTKPLLEKFKQIQGGDQTAKTVIAIGCDDYTGDVLSNFTATLMEVANTYTVDIVIAISSVASLLYKPCNAFPPTVLTSTNPRYEGLLKHWHIVSPRANYTRPSIQTGLSFDLSTLEYNLVGTASSLNESLFSPCHGAWRDSRNLLCANGDFRSKADNYFGDQVSAYGVLTHSSKVVLMSEYNDSVAFKFTTGVNKQGLRQRTAWLLYNVHLQDFSSKCPEPPYTVIRLFCLALKGQDDQRCQ
ncbi:uncharacterized protein [Dermacentor albipictus]|uniref:uncharacterized protein isoform X3 n=1 Tax=Dermacentor albipictus TaxID=60249 RepID=UPI0038FC4C33